MQTSVDGENRTRAHWVHGLGIDEPLYMERDLNANGTFEETERFFYHADGLGSTVALTNNTGQVVERYRYETFGQPTITGPGPDGVMDTPDDVTLPESAYGNPYLFTGREYDPETGLYYYRRRYYDSRTGRFLTEDPLGFGAGVNFYTFVLNNPLRFVDPFGTSTWPIRDKVEEVVKEELGKLPNVPLLPGKDRQQSIDEYAKEIAKAIPNRDALDLANPECNRANDILNNLIGQLKRRHPDWPWEQIEDMINQSIGGKS